MTIAPGPRPWSIRLFAIAFFVSALAAFLSGLSRLELVIADFQDRVPALQWTADMAIVTLSARLSIALIPIALVWFLANNFARWVAAILAVGKIINIPGAIDQWQAAGYVAPGWAVSHVLAFFAAAMLFTPSANYWFKSKGRNYASVFD